MLRSILVPLRRTPRLGDTGRGGGFADVLENGPNVHRLGNEGDRAAAHHHSGQQLAQMVVSDSGRMRASVCAIARRAFSVS